MTIYTVAERAGVSISTVSLAINHPERVNEATRRRIVAAAGELGYRPTGAASDRARGSAGRIAVIAPFTSYPSYAARLGGVLAATAGSGVDVIVHDLASAAASSSPLLDALPVRGSVDGVILMGLPLSREGIDRLQEWGPPVVLVDTQEHEFSSVLLDDERGGYLIGKHLVERGHERVAFVHETQKSFQYVSAGMLRMTGVKRALDEVGLLDGFTAVESADGTVEGGRAAASRIDGSTGVFANHDQLAAGVRIGLRERGLEVPRDLALAGFDDGPLAQGLELTTIRQPFEESGRVAADLLLSRIDRPGQSVQRIMLSGELVVRRSTGAQHVPSP